MLLKYFLFLILAVCFLAASAKKCPTNSVPTLTNPDMCYTWVDLSVADSLATYNDAETACQNKGGHLASIPNQEENTYFYDLINNRMPDGYYWIGINDLDEHGKWKWSDGSPVNYFNLDQFEPGDCGVVDRHEKKWYTDKCERKLNYICLIPAV